MFERILIPLDESDLSHRIMNVVRRLVRTNPQAAIRLVRVLTPHDAEPTEKSDPAEEARAHLDHVVDLLTRCGVRADCSLFVGDPASEILKTADEFEPSLIAMASHGRSGIPRWIRGSVAERVLEGARHPLLLANPIGLPDDAWWAHEMGSPDLARAIELKQILVPLDGSESSAQILPMVQDVASEHDSEVTLLHVRGRGDVPPLENFARRLAGVSVRTVVEEGDPASVILREAGARGFDLVAMTTHGHTTISRWAFGSVAEHVLHQCVTPILVKRTAGFAAHAVVLPTE